LKNSAYFLLRNRLPDFAAILDLVEKTISIEIIAYPVFPFADSA
jgi:hypothetical protein